MTSIPGQTIGVSVFTDHLIEATGLSRLDLSNAYLVGTVTSGCLLPLGGKLLDRWGARRVVVFAAVGLGLTLCYLATCDRLSQALSTVLPLTATTLAAILLVLGFVSLRFCGQGMLTMTSRTMLGKWFERRRGQVSGMVGIFVSFGFSSAPFFFSKAISALGWRETWLVLAAIVGIGMSAVGWLLFRDNPEICGLRMDGDADLSRSQSEGSRRDEDSRQNEGSRRDEDSNQAADDQMWGLTRREAIGTLTFWATTLAFASQALSITGITFHVVSIGAELGISEARMVTIFIPISVVSTAVGFLVGIASDRVRLQYIFMFMMVGQVVGIGAIANLNLTGMIVPATVGLGISGGCFGTLTAVVLPRFFGRLHLGAISGVQMMAIVIASAIGPSLLANVRAVTGSYQGGLYACCLFAPVVIGLMFVIQPPVRAR